MTGEWFKIEKLSSGGIWEEMPIDRKYENEHGEVSVMFNAIGWIVEPRNTLRLTVRPWFYKQDWQSGNPFFAFAPIAASFSARETRLPGPAVSLRNASFQLW